MKTHFYTEDITRICDNKHLTVDEIFEYISKKYPNAGKSSIYRNVEELHKNGFLKKISGTGKKTFFEKTKEPHIHFIDEKTGKIFDGNIKSIPIFEFPDGFEVSYYDIKIFGNFTL